MARQPYVYTMPESFLKDRGVPARWRVLAVINGFLINGGCFYGSNEWLMEQLDCSEQTISNAFAELEGVREIRIERTRRSRRVYKRDPNQLGSETLTDSSRDPNSFGTNSVSNSEKNTGALEDEQRGYEVITLQEEETTRAKKPPKYKNAKTVFSWFPRPEKNWNLNTTELSHAELLFERGEVAVRGILEFLRENEGAEFLPEVSKPSDLERKWTAIIKFAERNGL